jgi:hypothetical protein
MGWMIWGSNPGSGKKCFSSLNLANRPRSLGFHGFLGYFPGVKRAELDIDYSSPYSTKIKNNWSCTSTPLYAFTAQAGTA